MSGESKYVQRNKGEDGKEHVTILAPGHINSSNLSSFRLSFGKPADITADLDKRNQENTNSTAPENKGRTGYAGIETIYPDEEKSSKVVLKDCIIQYRESAFKEASKANAANYGISYVQIGIPSSVINRLYHEGIRQGVNLENRRNTREKNGYHWMNCNIDKLNTAFITAYVAVGDEDRVINDTVRRFLEDAGTNIHCTITATVSCTTTTATREERLDLKGAFYHLTIRPFEIIIEEESEIEGPQLADISIQTKNETSEVTESSMARGKLAKKMMARLKINK